MLLLHAGAGPAHAAPPQHCAVLRSLLGAQQHVLCHRAHEGNTSLCVTSVGTYATFSQLVIDSNSFGSHAAYSLRQVSITVQPVVRNLQHTLYECKRLEEAVHLYTVQAKYAVASFQSGKHWLL